MLPGPWWSGHSQWYPVRRLRLVVSGVKRNDSYGRSISVLRSDLSKPCETTAKYEFKLYFKSAQEKSFVGCRAGAATESRPYRCFHCCGAALMAGEPNIEAQFVLQVSDVYSPKIRPFSESGL